MPEPEARPALARLFLALWPDADVREMLSAWRDGWNWPRGAAVVADERLHMTLHFIGAVAATRVDAVAAGLAVPFVPFTLDGGCAEHWRGGLAAWRPRETPPELAALHERLAQALRRLALPVEQRPFKPHVTLARKATGASAPAAAPATLVWPVEGYALVQSQGYAPVQSQGGYRVLRRYT